MFARRMDKDVSHIPEDLMEVLCQHAWPGNVRELQNLLERAVIMSSGPELHVPSGDLEAMIKSAASSQFLHSPKQSVTIFSRCSGILTGWGGTQWRGRATRRGSHDLSLSDAQTRNRSKRAAVGDASWRYRSTIG
jgi:DNA-binding NtrC family response regulator